MTDTELENIIRTTLKSEVTPSRVSLSHTLSKLEDLAVTETEASRYTTQTKSNIISNGITDILNIWRSKRIVLVPSLILLLFVGAFSLSPRQASNNNQSLQQLVAQDELFEDLGVDNDGDWDNETMLTSFDDPAINDLSAIQI